MRFLISIIVCALLASVMERFLPWWSVAIATFLVSMLWKQSAGKSFLMGFLAVFLLWFIMAFVMSRANDNILAARMAQLFQLPNALLFMAIAAIVGGIVGGMGAWCGTVVSKSISKKS